MSYPTLPDPVDPDFVRDFQLSTLAHPVPQTFLNAVVRESLKVPARVWRAALEGLLVADFSADLREIKTRTVIAWGDQDAAFPRAANSKPWRPLSQARDSSTIRAADTRSTGKIRAALPPISRTSPQACPTRKVPPPPEGIEDCAPLMTLAHCLS